MSYKKFRIEYRKRKYKYRLEKSVMVKVPIYQCCCGNAWVQLDCDGTLMIMSGYAWDGPSGPTIDTKDSMAASLVHDALYQLMRLDQLNERYRGLADSVLRDICIAKGMPGWRANLWYWAVRKFANACADGDKYKKEKVYKA